MPAVIGQISGTIQQSIAVIETTTRATAQPDDWSVCFYFEDGDYDSNNQLVRTEGGGFKEPSFPTRRVSRRFGDIKDDQETVNGKTLSVAELAMLLKQFGYRYRAENVAAEAVAERAADPA